MIIANDGNLYTGSFDHYIIQWDLEDILEKIENKL